MAFNFSVFQTKTAVQTGLFCSSFFRLVSHGHPSVFGAEETHLSEAQRRNLLLLSQ